MRSAERTIRIILSVFLLIFLIGVSMAFVAMSNLRQAAASSDWVNHTHAVILQAGNALDSAYSSEASIASFFSTSDPRDRAAAISAVHSLEEQSAVLSALTRDDPAAASIVRLIQELISQRCASIKVVVEANSKASSSAQARQGAPTFGLGQLSELKARVDELCALENAELAKEDSENYRHAVSSRWTVGTALVLELAMLAGASWIVGSDIALRRRRVEALQKDNGALETAVAERTSELKAANQKLHAEALEHRWAKLAMEHQTRYYSFVVDAIREPVMLVTKALKVSRVNAALLRNSSRAQESVIDEPLSSLVKLEEPANGKEAADPLASSLREGREVRNRPAFLVTGNGESMPVFVNLYPLRDGDHVVGAAVILDVRTAV